jgi:mRNA-degrading endonuclease RelE of RelBE toxin-antitoxin system
LSYKLNISEDAFSKLEGFGMSNAKLLRQIFIKILSLRRNPKPQDCKELLHFNYAGFKGYRMDQGEYRIIYAIAEKNKAVKIGYILNRNEDYRERKHKK